jgi:hypothetical protein
MNVNILRAPLASRSAIRSALTLQRPASAVSSLGLWRQPFSTSSNAQTRPKSTFEDVTFESLVKTDDQLKALQNSQYRQPASDARIATAKAALEKRGFKVHVVKDRAEAFDKVKSLIPDVGVMCSFLWM